MHFKISKRLPVILVLSLLGCASGSVLSGTRQLSTPPEFNQKVLLDVQGDFTMFQAPRSQYDVGDLQNFHTQHTFPYVIEGAFQQLFGKVEPMRPGMKIETEPPDAPAIFEVKLLDVANDIYIDGADYYRGEVTLAVAMKSPKGNIFWQKAIRGDGYAEVDPQYSLHTGPQDALANAVHKAVEDMQDAIIASPEVRLQMKYYRELSRSLERPDNSSK